MICIGEWRPNQTLQWTGQFFRGSTVLRENHAPSWFGPATELWRSALEGAHMRGALLLAVLLTPACGRHSSPKAEGPSPPSKEEVIGYLEGKEVPMPQRAFNPEADAKVYRLRRDQIAALEVEPGWEGLASPECNRVSFLANVDGERFAVRAVVESRLIEGRRAFSQWMVLEAVRQ